LPGKGDIHGDLTWQLTAQGERKSATMTSSWSTIAFDKVSDFNALDRCITRGMPASMFPFMYNSGIEIVQSPGYVVIRLEPRKIGTAPTPRTTIVQARSLRQTHAAIL
jgi:hypothetical protein